VKFKPFKYGCDNFSLRVCEDLLLKGRNFNLSFDGFFKEYNMFFKTSLFLNISYCWFYLGDLFQRFLSVAFIISN